MKKILSLFAILVISNVAIGQIPNGDFELWDSTAGYKSPVGWDNMNPVTNSFSTYTCVRQTPGYSGNYFMQLITRNISGLGIVRGLAVSGKMDSVTHLPATGFPFTGRPQLLAGVWQYMPFNATDQGNICVLLSKWNTTTLMRDTVAYTLYSLPGMVMTWTPFAIGLNYMSIENPDSAMIILSSSGHAPVPLSFLWIDELRLTDSNSLFLPASNELTGISLSPNPAYEHTLLRYNSTTEKEIKVSITDLCGRVLTAIAFTATKGANNFPIDLSGLPNGLFMVSIATEQSSRTLKLIIQ